MCAADVARAVVIVLVGVVGVCGVGGAGVSAADSERAQEETDLDSADCDPLVPEYCGLPFPNNYWLNQETGKLSLGKTTFPVDRKGVGIDPDVGGWNDLEGFSVFPSINAYFPGMGDYSIENCPRLWNMDLSLNLEQSPTVLLDAETGELVAHWVELDYRSVAAQNWRPGPASDRHAMLIWPSERLASNHRYIVGIKRLPGKDGVLLPRSDAFEALVFGKVTDDDRIESRRQHYETDLFPTLASVGFSRSELLLAWDFKTNTVDSITRKTITARDDSAERLPEGGPEYKIGQVEYNTSDTVYAKINGVFKMPMYLNTHLPKPDARLVTDDMGNVVFQRWAWFRFEVIVPWSLVNNRTSGRIVQYGHGLFSQLDEVDHDYLTQQADDYGYVLCASNWIGLSEQDVPADVLIVAEDFTNFMYVPDRETQSLANALGLMKMMAGSFAQDPLVTFDGVSVIDPTRRSYTGNSEGGIFGTVYMAVTQDVERGVVGVPGGPYGLLLPRSMDFAALWLLVEERYPDPVDRINIANAMQCLWDRAEPSGYMDAINRNLLPNTPMHQILVQNGKGDAQVTWLGAQAIARSVDGVMYESNVRCGNETFFGFDMIGDDSTVISDRSGIVTYDYGAPDPPYINLPADKEYDSHESVRRDTRAQEQMHTFFTAGEIVNTCGGTCD